MNSQNKSACHRPKLLPGGKVIGKEYVVRNPTRADKRAGSFEICISGPKAGVWSDFAASAKGGDLVSLEPT